MIFLNRKRVVVLYAVLILWGGGTLAGGVPDKEDLSVWLKQSAKMQYCNYCTLYGLDSTTRTTANIVRNFINMISVTAKRKALTLKECANIVWNLLMSLNNVSLAEDYEKNWSCFKDDQSYITLLFFTLCSEDDMAVSSLNAHTVKWLAENLTGEGLTQSVLKCLLQGSPLGAQHWEKVRQDAVKDITEKERKSNSTRSLKRKRDFDGDYSPEIEGHKGEIGPPNEKRFLPKRGAVSVFLSSGGESAPTGR